MFLFDFNSLLNTKYLLYLEPRLLVRSGGMKLTNCFRVLCGGPSTRGAKHNALKDARCVKMITKVAAQRLGYIDYSDYLSEKKGCLFRMKF